MIIQRTKSKIRELAKKNRYQFFLLLDQFCSFIPGAFGWSVRRYVYKNRMVMGENVMIEEHVCIKYPERMSIGSNSLLGRGTMIQASGHVEIGRDVLIGPFVKIWSSDHVFDSLDIPIHRQGHAYAKVSIEDDVWIGTNAIVVKGVRIEKSAVVSAGAIVTKDVPKHAVVAGNPAKTIKYRMIKGSTANEL